MNNEKNALNAYLKDIKSSNPLDDAEEKKLAERIAAGDSRALDKLTQANLGYVVSLAHQYEGRGLATEDLIAEGNIGMLQAASRFKAEGGKRFVAFAAPYIRQAMEQAIEQQTGLYQVPHNAADTKLEKRRSKALSIDAPLGGSRQLSLGHVLPDVNAAIPDETLEHDIMVGELELLTRVLQGRERQVIMALYSFDGMPKTMAEVAKDMGLKRERVRQIRDRALRRIHKATRLTDIRDFV